MSKQKENKENKLFKPVTTYPEIPFALAEIVGLTEGTNPQAAQLAESILDLLLGFPSLSILALSDDQKAQLRASLGVVWMPQAPESLAVNG